METLEVLASITKLSPNIIRVLGQNPGKFTLQGTNTYIVGRQRPYILVDTGEGREEYVPILESALKGTSPPENSDTLDVSDVIISHWHGDHVGGLPSVLALLRRLWDERKTDVPFTPPRLHKFPLPVNELPERSDLPSIIHSLPSNSFTPASDRSVFHDLQDGQELKNSSTSLRVLHTPGHTRDSICLFMPEDRALYTADTVLGQGTAVFEDLQLYISSLRKMLDYHKSNTYGMLYPGHGPVVPEGTKLIETYIKHRLEREAQVLQVLQTTPPSDAESSWTTWTIVSKIYQGYPESLWTPAAHSIALHMKKLEADGIVKKSGGEGVHTSWYLNSKL
ncbi:beta-lactamase-like protein [Lentinula aciculospora]|uniref:Beta-lactamase-like protein n=1 Tax=Lentinula aciculospora TaxID=153920 RepID=A0A9W9DX13_9AGAR|nr:beta-lactamase-like protein [Lentinula aciculospora]